MINKINKIMLAAVIQENNQIAGDILGIMKIHKTNLTKICKKYDLNYQITYRSIHSPIISLDFLRSILMLISPDIKVEFSINKVSLDMEIIYIP